MGKAISKLFGSGDKAAKDAAEAQARAAASAEAARVAQENIQKNFAADLKQENVSNVVAGGTAESADMLDPLKKKKSTAGGLAATLGINV